MRFPRTLALPLASVALAMAGGLAVGTFAPSAGGGTSPSPITTVDPTEAAAWEIYDNGGGSSKIRVDPTRPYRVDFVSATHDYPSWAAPDDAVVVGKDGRWFWFAVTYTDKAS